MSHNTVVYCVSEMKSAAILRFDMDQLDVGILIILALGRKAKRSI